MAIGTGADTSSFDDSVAIGFQARVGAINSVAIGSGSFAGEDNIVSIGSSTTKRRITNLAAGVDATDAVNVSQLMTAIAAIPAVDVAALQAADVTLQNNIDAEATTRAAADTTLQTNLDTEASARASGDATLQGNIDSEATTRASADMTLQTNLDAEANARLTADTQLTQQVDTVSQGLATEQGQRAATDTALANRLSILEGSMVNLDARFNRLSNHIAAGTAVATAMSGNAFLPDMKFNLTANVATYDGAHAGAIQMGALVSRHTAVNAGVATGFNKGGKMAGRVGFTFGW